MAIDKIFYNESSSKKLGWSPLWFGGHHFDDELIKRIEDFQKRYSLVADGLVGPVTFRRIYTEVEANLEMLKKSPGSGIIINGLEIPIQWDKMINMRHEDSLALPPDCFEASLNFERRPTMIVTHWDAALSATSCKKILERRSLSSHFVIDNDGTIYQMVDVNNTAWHAGGVNDVSIGIDFSNAFYPKYQKVYLKRNFGRRPLLTSSKVHGRSLEEHLGYYPQQLEAYTALLWPAPVPPVTSLRPGQ